MRLARRGLLLGLFTAASTATALAAEQKQAPASRQDRLTSAETYIPLPTLSAGVLQRYSTAGTIVVDMGIDVPDVALRRHARLNQPRLRDALRTALASYATVYYRDRTAPLPGEIVRLMQQAVDRVLGAEGARVLLANVIYQRRSG